MAILSQNNIESELSYAYLHAVAAASSMECVCSGRHLDNSGVDAIISARERFAADSLLTDISLHVQLKATTGVVKLNEKKKYPYFFKGIDRYNQFRSGGSMPPRILVVLYLPPEPDEWLSWTADRLVLQRCAYWVSLVGAPETDNATGAMVYLPEVNQFSPKSLREIMTMISRMQNPTYDQ